MISVEHAIPRTDVLLGLLTAGPVRLDTTAADFSERLEALLAQRQQPLTEAEEATRAAVRNMLRNGRYKPTGRSKPASEYLLRSAGDTAGNGFPRINGPVDVCNYISLKYLVPISLWDLDLAGTDHFRFRLGRAGEAYAFNAGGQEIDVEDLVVGSRVTGGADEPIVNPVKDSLATKTTDRTARIAACIYAPYMTIDGARLLDICEEFGELLPMSEGGTYRIGVAARNETISL